MLDDDPANVAGHAVRQHREVGLRPAHRRRLLRAAARRVGHHRRRMTIAAPELVVTKTGPATHEPRRVGPVRARRPQRGPHEAWNVTLADRLPDGATGGMCDLTPEILSAQVFAADGVTPVPGKGPLVRGHRLLAQLQRRADLRAHAHACSRPPASIGPSERLIVRYRTQLDADSAERRHADQRRGRHPVVQRRQQQPGRQPYTRTLTNGTVGDRRPRGRAHRHRGAVRATSSRRPSPT